VAFDGVLLSQRPTPTFPLVNTMQCNFWKSSTSINQPIASYLPLSDNLYHKDVKLPQSYSNSCTLGDAMINGRIGDESIIGKFIGDIISGDYINDIGNDGSININIIGDITGNDIMGYQPVVSCSSVLKKRKKKMNKHKYKKRRKRDKFKRRNLENIKERKKRMKEKAEERMKAALV